MELGNIIEGIIDSAKVRAILSANRLFLLPEESIELTIKSKRILLNRSFDSLVIRLWSEFVVLELISNGKEDVVEINRIIECLFILLGDDVNNQTLEAFKNWDRQKDVLLGWYLPGLDGETRDKNIEANIMITIDVLRINGKTLYRSELVFLNGNVILQNW